MKTQFQNLTITTHVVVLFTLLTGCQQVLPDFNPKGSQQRLVIEGLVTDSVMYHHVRLTYTSSYLNNETMPVEPLATVCVREGALVKDTLKYIGDGVYRTTCAWAGVPGLTYTLEVKSRGNLYMASETMPLLADFKIDSVQFRFDEVSKKEYLSEGFSDGRRIQKGDSIFRAFFYAIESKANTNYYLFEFKRNTHFYQTQNDIIVADDQNIAELIKGIELPGEYFFGDTATVFMYGITRQAYQFYRDLENVMNSDGGMFSPPAGNPMNNLNNGALGYFQVSALRSKATILLR